MGASAAREDVEDQLRAVDDLEVGGLRDRAGLGGCQVLIHHDEVCRETQGADDQVFQLAGAHQGSGVEGRPLLQDPIDHRQIARCRQLGELVHRRLGGRAASGGDVDEDGASFLSGELGSLAEPLEFLLEGANEIQEVIVNQPGRARRKQTVTLAVGHDVLDAPARAAAAAPGHERPGRKAQRLHGLGGFRGRRRAGFALGGGQQVGDPHRTGQTVLGDADDRERVEPVKGERCQVSGGELFVTASRGQKPQRAKAVATGRRTGLSRDGDALGVPDRDRLDPPRAIDQHTHTAIERVGHPGHLAGQLVSQNLLRWDATPIEPLETMLVCRRKPQQLSMNRRDLE